jgi:hypothetical protein
MSKIFIGIVYFIISVSLFKFLPLNFAGIANIVMAMVAIIMWPKYIAERTINSYRSRIEDVFIVGKKKDGTPWEFPAKFNHLIVQVPWNKVMVNVAKHQYYLEQSKNEYYNDMKLPKSQRLQVIGLIQGDGEYIYEDDEGFVDRCIDRFVSRGTLRHKTIRSTKPEYYHENLNFQKGENWKTQ